MNVNHVIRRHVQAVIEQLESVQHVKVDINSHPVQEHVHNVQQEHRLLEEQRQVVHNVQLDIIQKQELEVAQSVQLEQQLLLDLKVAQNVQKEHLQKKDLEVVLLVQLDVQMIVEQQQDCVKDVKEEMDMIMHKELVFHAQLDIIQKVNKAYV